LYVTYKSWRTTGDIQPRWSSILNILQKQQRITQYAGPGGWNDPDMLQVGNGNLTVDEQKSHFSLWAALKAPLLLGFDVSYNNVIY
jgi:alpha-galactosidase